jgi:hypothetical protein
LRGSSTLEHCSATSAKIFFGTLHHIGIDTLRERGKKQYVFGREAHRNDIGILTDIEKC